MAIVIKNKFYKKSLFFFVFILCLSFNFIVSISSIKAVEYGGIGGRPAYPRSDNPRTESIFVHTVSVGQKVEEGVKVSNNTDSEKTIMVYSVDSEVSSGGAFACSQKADSQKDVGNWIKLSKAEVTIPSLKSEIVPFTINIPDNASVGEHNGCIIIQEKKAPTQSDQQGVTLTFRSGIRVALLIPGDITRKLELAGFSMTQKDNGLRILTPKVKNTGNVSIDTQINMFTDYFFGRTFDKKGGGYPILRGETSEWNYELNKPFWGGFYKSYYTAEYDASKEAGIGSSTTKEKTVLKSAPVWFFSFPELTALLVEILILVILIALIFFLIRFLLGKKAIKKNWIDYTIQRDDNINLLALKYKVPWKQLARANKLKAPYHLEEGRIIKVPPMAK